MLTSALLSIILTLSFVSVTDAKGAPSDKSAILLIAFGTSYQSARGAIDTVGAKVARLYPNTEIRWAFTSKIIRGILKKRGEEVLSPAEALTKLGEDGYKKVYVQSLHIIPGDEFDDVVTTSKAFSPMPKGVQQVVVGKPLLWNNDDMAYVANALKAHIPMERKPNEAIIYMGHGSKHTSNVYYAAMQYYLTKVDPKLFIGTVEATPTLNDIIPSLKSQGVKRVWLIPFMLVAGDHATNDMAGDEPDSWKSILKKNGFEVTPILQGFGDYDEVSNLWVKHLQEVIAE